MRAGNRFTNPLHVTPMEIWVRIGRLEAVGPTDLADLDRTLPLQGQDHPVTRLDLVSKRPDLAGPVLDGSGFGFWIVLLQRQDQALAVNDLRQVPRKPIPGQVHPGFLQEFLLVFAVRPRPDQPDRNAHLPPVPPILSRLRIAALHGIQGPAARNAGQPPAARGWPG